jgi:hypothetical protein
MKCGATKIVAWHSDLFWTVGIQMFFGEKEISFGDTNADYFDEVILDNPTVIYVSEQF